MSIEIADAAPVEPMERPTPWIVQYQREHCAGSTPLTTFQGVLIDEIYVPQSAADHGDPAQLVLAANAWVDALLEQAHFLPGEFSHEGLWSFYARDYLIHVQAGGHEHYFAKRGEDEIALKCASAALKSMLADPHADLLTLLLKLKRATPQASRKIAAEHKYRSVKDAMKGLDARFAELESNEPLTTRQKTWLKSLRKVKVAPDAEMTAHLQRAAQANPLFVQRRAESQRLRAAALQASPSLIASKALVDMTGAQITNFRVIGAAPMRSVWPDGPDLPGFVCRADTNQGARVAVFYTEGRFSKRYLSVLVAEGGGLPVASLALGKAEYGAIVG